MSTDQHARSDYPGSVLAKLLNITERRLQQLAREGIIPKSNHGKYPLAGVIRGYVIYLQNAGVNAEGNVDPEKLEPFKRKAWYQGEHDKLRLQIERSELLTSLDVEQTFGATFKLVADFLDTLPDILERDCGANAAMITLIEKRLDKLREELFRAIMERCGDAAGAAEVGR